MRKTLFKMPSPLIGVLALGFANQLGQLLMLRELLMVFHGHELTLGIILAGWVFWEGAGSWLGGVIAQRTAKPRSMVLALGAAATIVMPISIIMARVMRVFFDVVPGARLSIYDAFRVSFLVQGPLCILLGAQFVLLARLWREHRRKTDMSGAVRTYVVEALGHMAGGLVFSLLLVHFMSPLQVAAVCGVFMLSGLLFLFERKSKRRHFQAAAILVFFMALPFLSRLDMWGFELQWRHFLPDSELMETKPSRYGRINVVRRDNQYSFFQSNHFAFSTGEPDVELVAFEELEAATLAHMAMSQHPEPQRILLIGGGMRGVLRELLRYDKVQVDYIELDRMLVEAAVPYLPRSTRESLTHDSVNLITTDGRLYVKTTDVKYDLALIDLPDPETAVLNRFYTREFFTELGRCLNPNGILAMPVTSTPSLRHLSIVNRNATIFHTLREVFEDVISVGNDICLFLATGQEGNLTVSAQELAGRYAERQVESPDFSGAHFHTFLREPVLLRKNWILRHHGRSREAAFESPDTGPLTPPALDAQRESEKNLPPVERRYFLNSDFHPIAYYHTLILLNHLMGAEATGILRRLLRIRLWWILPFLGAAVIMGGILRLSSFLIHRRRFGGGYAVGTAVFGMGFSSMLLQMVLLFSFQSVYGYIYEQVGMIMAVFMGGLAFGCWMSSRLMLHKPGLQMLGYVQGGCAVFAALTAAILPLTGALRSPVLIFFTFALMVWTAGTLTGAHYPAASGCRHLFTGKTERSAGFAYSMELIGACSGAVSGSIVLIPVLGLPTAALTACAFNITAILIIWIYAGTDKYR